MRGLRWFGAILGVLVAAGCVLAVTAPYGDGPIFYFRGGALMGVVKASPVGDWNRLVENGSAIELETRPSDPYSVNIEARIREGRLYSWSAWEHGWNTNVLANPDVVVRVGKDLYELRAVQVTEPEELSLLHGAPVAPGEVSGVAFRFDPRP